MMIAERLEDYQCRAQFPTSCLGSTDVLSKPSPAVNRPLLSSANANGARDTPDKHDHLMNIDADSKSEVLTLNVIRFFVESNS